MRSLSDHLGGAVGAQERHLPAAGLHQLRDGGSRTDSNRSLQWGEKIVEPVFESKNDYDIMYMFARKFGFADQMFKNIKVENGAASAEDILREINRGGWSTGYCGQSPERLKAHMRNQPKFDLVTLRAPKDDPEVGGDYYGLPWPCWGTPEFKHPGTPILYNTNLPVKEGGGTFRARFGVERVVKRKVMETAGVEREDHDNLLAEGSYSVGSEIKDGYPEFTLGVLKKLGWDKDLTPQELRGDRAHRCGQSRTRCHGRPISPAASSAWRSSTGARLTETPRRARSRGICPIPIPVHREPIYTPRPDLVAKYPTLPDARQFRVPNIGFTVQKAAVDKGIVKQFPLILTSGPAGRIRRRRRGNAIQQMARRAEAGHVRRDQSGGRGRARHQRWRLGLGDRAPRAARRPG